MNLEAVMKDRAEKLQRFLAGYFKTDKAMLANHLRLLESVRYSLLQEGGKRFRPVLAMLTAEALGGAPERALPFGAAIECIHTYSLIHDDLPAMDNDDLRRGQPTNHKAYDEATAILAGDALLTEAFQMIAESYGDEPSIAIHLVREAAQAAGLHGMVGGQAIDMGAKSEAIALDELRTMHALKTGALIRVSARGGAIAAGASDRQIQEITFFAENLGLAFQVADDLLDYDPAKVEPGSYPALLGPERTREFLSELTQTSLKSIEAWPERAEPLRAIARYNGNRHI